MQENKLSNFIYYICESMGLKDKYANKKLQKKEAEIQRKPEIPNLDTIKKVGVIWHPEQKEAFHYLQEYFSKKQVIFRSLCVYNEKNEMAIDSNSIILKDLNWWGFPKPGIIDSFAEMQFDLLLNISLEQNLALDYITLTTQAKFKIGWSPNEKNYFDLNINIVQNQDALYLAKQQIFYLGQLNKKTSK